MLSKELFSSIGILIGFIAYFPYLRALIKNKIRPHIFTWFVWSIIMMLLTVMQYSAGAGAGAWISASTGALQFFIFLLSLKNGKKYIKPMDWLYFAASLLSIPIWYFTQSPDLSVILLCFIIFFAYLPTIRKGYHNPHDELPITFICAGLRNIFMLLALAEYNLATALSSAVFLFVDIGVGVMLIFRRRSKDARIQALD